jgi:hypothetical protein
MLRTHSLFPKDAVVPSLAHLAHVMEVRENQIVKEVAARVAAQRHK